MNTNKNFFIILAIILIIAVVAVGYWYYQKTKDAISSDALEQADSASENLGKQASQGVLPPLGTNPLENQPDINPAGQANPFSGIKTNPFK